MTTNINIAESLSTIVTSQAGILESLIQLKKNQDLFENILSTQLTMYNDENKKLNKSIKTFTERLEKLELESKSTKDKVDDLEKSYLIPLKDTFIKLIEQLEADITIYKSTNKKQVDDFNTKVDELKVDKTLELLIKTFEHMKSTFDTYNENIKVQNKDINTISDNQCTVASRVESLDNRMQCFNKILVNTTFENNKSGKIENKKDDNKSLDNYFEDLNKIENALNSNNNQTTDIETTAKNINNDLERLKNLTNNVLGDSN